ncbi:4-hydroxy-tetrahydrodipicolinate synthase [Kibdelosporangium philippinense]|uniref:4-hydroxy-tetrahydrodipicolinate synthase n=1 Tax=Kibdelosporangium philippinense TaxID=211113 RepID=A0ABS8ZA28_9PSEU|nr:4-hydroxy-tetrahydrodipicolinate synthase [Kibdelosporangium philippinense]MCE7004718.1 4-hydroxy-tetrahydrodipicolinate synthase [Kibdelosporangium philippinense]
MSLTGLFVPLVTPFTDADELAAEELEALAHGVLDDGASGIVALGTTGEPATLTAAERRKVVDICAGVCEQRGARLIIGAGSNSTEGSVDAFADLDSRVAATLTVVPYYTRPSEDGVVEHFRRLAATSPVPVIVYNVPARTGRALSADTLVRLAEIPNIIGFKHATGGIDDATVGFLSRVPSDVSVLSGDDLYTGALLALGASGAILACANVAARAYVDLIAAWRDGKVEDGRRLHNQLVPLASALFAEPNPTVIKAVLAAQGKIPTPNVRLPLLPASKQATATALEHAEI